MVKTIVVTGGPCSGKSTALGELQERFTRMGLPVVFVAEAATDLILEGVSPETLGSMLAFQIEVCALQLEREAVARKRAEELGPDSFVVCDRGVCDGIAYVTEEEYAQVLQANGLDADEARQRYDAVFCLESVAKLRPGAYTTENNATRSETAEQAAALCDRTAAAWATHPRFHFIPSSQDFGQKTAALFAAIMEELR